MTSSLRPQAIAPPVDETEHLDGDNQPALISAGRLGALLQARRSTQGVDVDNLAEKSAGRFTAGYLHRAEQGLVILTDSVARQLSELYDLEQGPVIPERHNRLIVDLPGRRVAVGSQSFDLARTTGPLSGDQLVDAVLERYLSLLYLLRGLEPGTELPIRDADLSVLGESLEVELNFVEQRLAELMLDDRVDVRTRSLIGRFLLPNAGLLVAATVVGSFIISSTSPEDVISTQTTVGMATNAVPAEQLIEAPDFPTTRIVVPAGNPPGDADSSADGDAVSGTTSSTARIRAIDPDPPDAELDPGPPSADADKQTAPGSPTVEQPATDKSPAAEPQRPDDTAEPATNQVVNSSDPVVLGAEAEALIPYDWRAVLPGWRVIYMADRPGYRGLTFPQTRSIEIYVDPDDTPGTIAEILAHELGHAIDVTHFSGADRTQWIEARQMPAVWWAGDGLNDFSVGAGDFAEAVARLWVGSPSNSTYGEFTPEQLELARQLLP